MDDDADFYDKFRKLRYYPKFACGILNETLQTLQIKSQNDTTIPVYFSLPVIEINNRKTALLSPCELENLLSSAFHLKCINLNDWELQLVRKDNNEKKIIFDTFSSLKTKKNKTPSHWKMHTEYFEVKPHIKCTYPYDDFLREKSIFNQPKETQTLIKESKDECSMTVRNPFKKNLTKNQTSSEIFIRAEDLQTKSDCLILKNDNLPLAFKEQCSSKTVLIKDQKKKNSNITIFKKNYYEQSNLTCFPKKVEIDLSENETDKQKVEEKERKKCKCALKKWHETINNSEDEEERKKNICTFKNENENRNNLEEDEEERKINKLSLKNWHENMKNLEDDDEECKYAFKKCKNINCLEVQPTKLKCTHKPCETDRKKKKKKCCKKKLKRSCSCPKTDTDITTENSEKSKLNFRKRKLCSFSKKAKKIFETINPKCNNSNCQELIKCKNKRTQVGCDYFFENDTKPFATCTKYQTDETASVNSDQSDFYECSSKPEIDKIIGKNINRVLKNSRRTNTIVCSVKDWPPQRKIKVESRRILRPRNCDNFLDYDNNEGDLDSNRTIIFEGVQRKNLQCQYYEINKRCKNFSCNNPEPSRDSKYVEESVTSLLHIFTDLQPKTSNNTLEKGKIPPRPPPVDFKECDCFKFEF